MFGVSGVGVGYFAVFVAGGVFEFVSPLTDDSFADEYVVRADDAADEVDPV